MMERPSTFWWRKSRCSGAARHFLFGDRVKRCKTAKVKGQIWKSYEIMAKSKFCIFGTKGISPYRQVSLLYTLDIISPTQ